MQRNLRLWLPLSILTTLGLLAAIGARLESGDLQFGGSQTSRVITVTTSRDRGPGSLRAAVFDAMKMPHAVTIQLAIDQINLDVPLPPIATTHGISIVGHGSDRTLIRRVDGQRDAAPILEIIGNDFSIQNLAIDAAGGTAIAISGERMAISNVSVVNARVAVLAVDIDQLTIRGSIFKDNFDGIRIGGAHGHAVIQDCEFANNRNSSVWTVFATGDVRPASTVVVYDNSFAGGRNPIVAGNSLIDLRGNQLHGFTSHGMLLLQSWATVSGNRILDSKGIGMHLSGLRDSRVVDNEIGRNELVGIMIMDASGLHVDSNNFYGNGYGIAAVGREQIDATLRNNVLVDHDVDGLIAIGRTPLIDGNHSLRNRQAGIRILDLLLPGQPAILASERLSNNVLDGNGDDVVQFGQYVVQAQ